jgi:hypothetical protein
VETFLVLFPVPNAGKTTKEIAMTKFGKNVATGFATILLVAALSACQKQEGPAERAGKEIDKTIDTAGQKIEGAGEKIRDSAKGDRK